MGHVAILLPIAEALRDAGHEPVFAVSDVKDAKLLLKDKGIPVYQAPYIPPKSSAQHKNITTHTLADIYHYAGYTKSDLLLALSKAWQDLLEKIKPDLVINEFAPTLALVTLSVIPTLTVGTGYSTPPLGRSMPAIRFWKKELPLDSILREKDMLITINNIRKSLTLPPIMHFSDLFGGEAQLVTTYPVLDCYRAYRQRPAIGPLNQALYRHDISLYNYRERRGFVYLNATLANLPLIIQGIKDSGLYCEAYIRGLSEEKRQEYSNPDFVIHTTTQALHEVLPYISLYIHHGGISSSELCLRYGTPQLILANHLEQRVNGSNIAQLGVGILLVPSQLKESQHITKAIASLIDPPVYKVRARHIAQQLEQRYPVNPLAQVMDSCVHWLQQPSSRKVL